MSNSLKKVLVVHYSQTGQLHQAVQSVAAPLEKSPNCSVTYLTITPATPYPFPWPFLTFINVFPESVHEQGCKLEKIDPGLVKHYDLIILGYQVWYLAPSIPIMAFLKSVEAETLFKDTPVITVIACRNMWLLAQERVKKHLNRLGARLIGNVALVDEAGAGFSFLSTPMWMLSGSKGPYAFGIPKAGVAEAEISNAVRFGNAIATTFAEHKPLDASVLQGLHAVKVNVNLVASEKIATRSFYLWGKLFLLFGAPESPARRILAALYALFLILMIVTVVPVNFLLKKALAPLSRKHNDAVRKCYAAPSGE